MKYRAWLWLVAAACGGSSSSNVGPGDAAGVGTDGEVDASVDAGLDAPPDAPMTVLSPDPADPVGGPCTGTLGFPNPPGAYSNNTRALQVVDADLDGNLDLTYVTTGSLYIARGNGTGALLPVTRHFLDASAVTTTAGRLADMNGDGRPDLVFGETVKSGGFHIAIRHAQPFGGYGPVQTHSAGGFVFQQLELVDMNGDGTRDIVAASSGDPGLAVLLRTPTGFAAPQSPSLAAIAPVMFAIGDLTGDGRCSAGCSIASASCADAVSSAA